MTNAILIILTLAGFASGAEFEVTDRLSVVSTAVFSGNVGIGTTGPQGTLHVRAAATDAIVVSSTTGNVGIGTTFPGSSLEVKGSSDRQYVLAVGTGTNYSLTVSTGGNAQFNGDVRFNNAIYKGTSTLLDSSMLDSFTLELDTTTNKIKLADRLEQNIMLDAFKIAVSSSLSKFNMVDGIMDEFEDESGVDTIGSSSQTYNSTGHYYSPLVRLSGLDSNTKLMLHFNSSINGSKEIQDSGNTGYIVTQVGTAALSTVQKKIGNCSLSLNGNSDYLTVPDSDDWTFGTGPFTIDYWVRFNDVTSYGAIGLCQQWTAGSNYWNMRWAKTINILYFITAGGTGGSTLQVAVSWLPVINTWYHIALVRVNTDNAATAYRVFINGVSQTLSLDAGAWNAVWGNQAAALEIGRAENTSYYGNGYIDEFRISKGIARWTTDFTPPTSAYISDADTQLLLHMESLDISSATAPKIPTFMGAAHLDTAQKEFGTASLFLNGSGDYGTVPNSADWNLGAAGGGNNFTIDMWLYFVAKTNDRGIITTYSAGGTGWQIYYHDGSGIGAYTDAALGFCAFSPNLNTWYHFAICRANTTTTMYINGTSIGTITDGNWNNDNTDLALGITAVPLPNNYFSGYMDEVRISKGIARWTTNFTPPAMEYSIITSTYDMVLVSTITTAMAIPANARLVLFEEDVDTVTLNSDINAYVTGKDTTTWTQVTLADGGYYQSGRRILSGMAGIAAASTGTAMRWKVETHSGRNIRLHGVGLSWD